MNLSERDLRAFTTLADVLQFTIAAERCHMTQSALSQLIARMEEQLGVRLFARGRRGVSLTAEGERLLGSARRIVKELDLVQTDLRAVSTLEAGHVTIATVPSLAQYWLPGALRPFRTKHGQVRVSLFDVSSERCGEMTRQGLVDFSISSQPGSPQEVDFQTFFEESMYIASPLGSAAPGNKELRLSDLRGMSFIHLHGTHKMLVRTRDGYAPARQILEEAGAIDSGLEVEQLATQAGLVAAGFGSCMVPACAHAHFARREITTRRISAREIVRPIYISKPRDTRMSIAAEALLNGLISHAASYELQGDIKAAPFDWDRFSGSARTRRAAEKTD